MEVLFNSLLGKPGFVEGGERERRGEGRMTSRTGKPLFQRIVMSVVTPLDELDKMFLGIRAKKRSFLPGLSPRCCGLQGKES